MSACASERSLEEIRGQLAEAGSLLPSRAPWGSNSGLAASTFICRGISSDLLTFLKVFDVVTFNTCKDILLIMGAFPSLNTSSP